MRTVVFYSLLALLATGSTASAQTNRKVVYGLLLDNSGSMRLQLPQVRAIGKAAVKQTYQRGPVTVFNFVKQGELASVTSAVDSSQDKDVLDKSIDNLAVTAGRTILLDSVHSMADKINLKTASQKDAVEKILILVTDGEDRMSSISGNELIRQLKESGFKIYAVGLVQDLDDKDGVIRKSAKTRAIDFLTTITKETGGRAVFPKSNKTNVDTLLSELLAP